MRGSLIIIWEMLSYSGVVAREGTSTHPHKHRTMNNLTAMADEVGSWAISHSALGEQQLGEKHPSTLITKFKIGVHWKK